MMVDLTPDTVYHIRVAAKSSRGEGAPTPTIQVRTEEYCEYQTLLFSFMLILRCCFQAHGSSEDFVKVLLAKVSMLLELNVSSVFYFLGHSITLFAHPWHTLINVLPISELSWNNFALCKSTNLITALPMGDARCPVGTIKDVLPWIQLARVLHP